MTLSLTPDELLSTTRSVRKRLDLERPVDLDLIRECLGLATQAPSGGNAQGWHFVVVTDPEKKQAIATLYRRAWDIYLQALQQPQAGESGAAQLNPADQARIERLGESASYLAEHFHELPVMLIACMEGRVEQATEVPVFRQATAYGSILPAVWSFMLAARARGLASCWTTLHLMFEQEAAQVLGIPYESITQAALIPVAYAKGTDFKPGARKPLENILHLEGW